MMRMGKRKRVCRFARPTPSRFHFVVKHPGTLRSHSYAAYINEVLKEHVLHARQVPIIAGLSVVYQYCHLAIAGASH